MLPFLSKRLLICSLLAVLCAACTPAPRSPSGAQDGNGISVYGTIDAGVVVNR